MKDTLLTSLRHAFTAFAGLGGYLLAHGAISADDVQSVNTAGASLGEALAVVAAALLARLVIWISGKIVSGGSVSMIAMCLCLGMLAVGGLSACHPGSNFDAEDWQATAGISFRDPATGAKAGLSFSSPAAPKVKRVKTPKPAVVDLSTSK